MTLNHVICGGGFPSALQNIVKLAPASTARFWLTFRFVSIIFAGSGKKSKIRLALMIFGSSASVRGKKIYTDVN
jgi:hypothetical protein